MGDSRMAILFQYSEIYINKYILNATIYSYISSGNRIRGGTLRVDFLK